MVAYPQAVVNVVKQYLRDNLTDVNTERRKAGKNWIHADFPRLDASMPRIGIQYISDTIMDGGINNDKISKIIIQITCVIDKTMKFDIDDDGEPEHAEVVIDYIAKQVAHLIKEGNDYFKEQLGDGFIHITPTAINPNRNATFIFRYVDVEVKYEEV